MDPPTTRSRTRARSPERTTSLARARSPTRARSPERRPSIVDKCWNISSNKSLRFAAVIITTSVCGCTLEEVKGLSQETLLSLVPNGLLEWEIVGSSVKEGTCCCSKEITLQHRILNRLNGNSLVVGSECINRCGSLSYKFYLSILSRSIKYEDTKRGCCYCGKFRISAAELKEPIPLCKSCRSEGRREASSEYLAALGEKCEGCKSGKIVPGSLIKYCKECVTSSCSLCKCLFLSKGEDNLHCPYCTVILAEWRICSSCKRPNIPVTEPEWKKRCIECYRSVQQVAVPCRKCMICCKDTIPVSEPEWKKICKTCFSKSKK